jgi:hypothetical protein
MSLICCKVQRPCSYLQLGQLLLQCEGAPGLVQHLIVIPLQHRHLSCQLSLLLQGTLQLRLLIRQAGDLSAVLLKLTRNCLQLQQGLTRLLHLLRDAGQLPSLLAQRVELGLLGQTLLNNVAELRALLLKLGDGLSLRRDKRRKAQQQQQQAQSVRRPGGRLDDNAAWPA